MASGRTATYPSNVTHQQTVEGGLPEPEALEPDQGSLDLAAPEDRRDRAQGKAEWEAAAAAVLRKARRLTDEDADELVWDDSPGRRWTGSASRRSARRSSSTG